MGWHQTTFNPEVIKARVRFFEIIRRFIDPSDNVLDDHGAVMAAFKRYAYWREVPLIDPNE